MSERSEYNPGEFCWVELAVPDPDAAAQFYGELIGWDRERYEPDPDGYWYLRYKGKLVAGLESIWTEGQVPAWLGYVRVDDAGESAGKVKDAGGTILEGPLEVPGDAGSLAICQDTEGAVFALWQPGQLKGAELVNEIGAWTWNQLVTRDLDKAKEFYAEVFGWGIESASDEAGAEPFFMWQGEGQKWEEGLAGAMLAGEDIPPEVPPHWQVYFCVESAESAIEQVNSLGGMTLFGPQRIPVGQLAVFNDPQGASFAIIEPDYPEAR